MCVKLICFIDELREKVEKNELSDEMNSLLVELFLSYETEKTGKRLNIKEYMKYVTLGWYIYSMKV